jgi:hypothetical protein
MVPEPLYLLSKNPELIGPTVFSVQTLARVVFQICNFGTFLGEFFWGSTLLFSNFFLVILIEKWLYYATHIFN